MITGPPAALGAGICRLRQRRGARRPVTDCNFELYRAIGLPREVIAMLPPWLARRVAPAAPHQGLEAGQIDALLRPLSSAERPDLRFFEALACPRVAAGVLSPGRYRMIAARNGWLPWLDRMLVRRCVTHLRAAPAQVRLLCRTDPDSLCDPAFVADLEGLATRSPALASRLAIALGRTRLPAPARRVLADLRDRGIAVALRRIGRHPSPPAELRRLGFDIVQLELDAGAPIPSSARFNAVGLALLVGHADAGPILELVEEGRQSAA
jgi:EAL domain-containing protein (putative c-di-GMP-specific phosphodiesterase class I)